VQNLGLAVVTIAAGIIVDSSGGSHFWLQIFFMFFLLSKAKLQSFKHYNKPNYIFSLPAGHLCDLGLQP